MISLDFPVAGKCKLVPAISRWIDQRKHIVSHKSWSILFFKGAIVLGALVLIGYIWAAGYLETWLAHINSAQISTWVAQAGYWGPVIIIGLMTVAVVVSPLPSAPIAIAAGAAYGHTYGTVYVIVGAFLGAMIAFHLSRWLGRKTIRRWFGKNVDRGLLGSQNALTATVFISRLLPFVSFDMISYAAGLSTITQWRFAASTLFGVTPMAFLMAHLGEMAIEGSGDLMNWFSLILGIVVAIPIMLLVYRKLMPTAD